MKSVRRGKGIPQLKGKRIFVVEDEPSVRAYLDSTGLLYLEKPYNVDDIKRVIREFFSRRA